MLGSNGGQTGASYRKAKACEEKQDSLERSLISICWICMVMFRLLMRQL